MALQRAALADNLWDSPLAAPVRERRLAGVVTGVVLGVVAGVVLGGAFAAGVHAGADTVVAMVPLVPVLVLARTRGSLDLRTTSS